MVLQANGQMKFTLSWIFVNLTEFLLIPRVSLQHGLSFGQSARIFRALFLILFPLSGLLAHCAPPPYRQPDCKISGFFFIKNLFIEGLAAITAVVDELPRKVNLHNLQVFSDCLCLYCYSHRQYRIRGSFLNFMDFLLK